MNILSGRNKKLYAGLIIGAIALAFYGISNVVSAFNDTQPSQITVETAAGTTQLSKGFDPGSPYCNPAGCAACRGCAGLQYSQNVEETSATVQVSLAE
jgi:hypothetical protein